MFTFSNRRSLPRSLLFICIISMPIYSVGGVIFDDGFESGDLSHAENGVSWWYGMPSPGNGPTPDDIKPYVSTEHPKTGSYSLKFSFGGSVDKDATSEQRFKIASHPKDLWIKFNLFIPSNYKNRASSVPGSNNKFMYVESAGQYVGFESWMTTDGGPGSAYIPMHLKYNGVDRGHDHEGQHAPYVQTNTDLNKWHEWIIHVKMATTSSSNDGAVEMWKNGVQVMENLNLPNYSPEYNYFEAGYLLGYANTGFDENTILYIDDVVFSTSKIVPEGGIASPNPPLIK